MPRTILVHRTRQHKSTLASCHVQWFVGLCLGLCVVSTSPATATVSTQTTTCKSAATTRPVRWTDWCFVAKRKFAQRRMQNHKNGGCIMILFFSHCVGHDTSAARLAQSAERKALNLVVVGSSPTVGVTNSKLNPSPVHLGVLSPATTLRTIRGVPTLCGTATPVMHQTSFCTHVMDIVRAVTHAMGCRCRHTRRHECWIRVDVVDA